MAQPKKEEAAVAGQGRIVILPNGVRRIDFIRDAYYIGKDGAADDTPGARSKIKNDINEMLKKEGPEAGEIPYQIVFSATKTKVDPRIAAKARTEAAAKVKADKEKAASAAAAKAK